MLRALLRTLGRLLVPHHDPEIALPCPNAAQTYVIRSSAFTDVDIDTDSGLGTWTYECPLCETHHQYTWGPPRAAYVGDTSCPRCRTSTPDDSLCSDCLADAETH